MTKAEITTLREKWKIDYIGDTGGREESVT